MSGNGNSVVSINIKLENAFEWDNMHAELHPCNWELHLKTLYYWANVSKMRTAFKNSMWLS
jgi:hypothetical protein